MQKNAITMCSYVFCVAAFCGFFRWIQNQAAFELETGLMISGSIWTKLTVAVLLLSVGGIFFMVRRLWYRDYCPAQTFAEVIHGDAYWVNKVAKILAGLMIIGSVILYLMAQYHVYHTLFRTLALLGIASAVAFVKLSEVPYEKKSPNMISLLAAIPVVMYCFWLIASYRSNAAVPSVWKYGLEILAICSSVLGVFYTAGYAFDYPKPYEALAWLLTGALLSLVTLTDSRLIGLQVMLLAGAGMQLFYAWMIISSMKEEWPDEAK